MSIRGRGVCDVIVQPRKIGRDNAKRTVLQNDGSPYWLRQVDVQGVRDWASEEEDRRSGVRYLTLFVMYTREWTADENALVWWDGYWHEVNGSPQANLRSPKTAHYRITLKRLGREPQPVVP